MATSPPLITTVRAEIFLKASPRSNILSLDKELSEIRKTWWIFPDYFWVVGGIVSCICFFYFHQEFVRVGAALVFSYCGLQLAYRSGILYGYVRGYESGYQEGAYNALKHPDEMATDLSHYEIQKKMEENIEQ